MRWGFQLLLNKFDIGPLLNYCNLFDIRFELEKIYVIENRLLAINEAGSLHDFLRYPFVLNIQINPLGPKITSMFYFFPVLSL